MTLDHSWLRDTVGKRFESDAAMEAFLPNALTPDELRWTKRIEDFRAPRRIGWGS